MKNKLHFISFVFLSVLLNSCAPSQAGGPAGGGAMVSSLIILLLITGLIILVVVKIRKKVKEAGENKSQNLSKKVIFAIVGAILGIPLSYYFQSEMVKSKMGGVGGYIQHFDQIVNNSNLLWNVILSVVIFTVLGGVIGYFMDESEGKKSN